MQNLKSEIKIQPIFFNFLVEENFVLENSKELIDYSYKKVKIDKEYIEKDNVSQTLILDTKLEILQPLIEKMSFLFNELHDKLGFKKNMFQKITETWVNINNNKNIDPPHNHPGSFFSGVYYLQADEGSSDIRFMTPNQSHSQVISPHYVDEYNGFNSSEWYITPKTGSAVLFPSWMYHYVRPHTGKYDRISIAFNTKIYDK